MTVRHHIVTLTVILLTLGGILAPAPSLARAPGIAAAAPNAALRTAARITPVPAAAPVAPTPPPDESAERRVIELVNAERTTRGLRPLSAQSQLARAADTHALDQRNRSCHILTHTGTDGSNMVERVNRTGYPWSGLAENIACGYANAASVMTAWMNSSGHRQNILNPDLTQIGVSLERSDRGATYWVQVFGTPR